MGAFGTWLTDRQRGGVTGMCAWRWPWPGTCFCSPGGGDRVCQGQHGAHTDSQQPSSRDLPRWAQARVCYGEVAAAVQALSEGPWQCHWAVAGGTSFPSVMVRAARSAARQDLVVAHTRDASRSFVLRFREQDLVYNTWCAPSVPPPRPIATLTVVPLS